MSEKDFTYKCPQCANTNSIKADWFKEKTDQKRHQCIFCSKISTLNIATIRSKFYNNFYEATVVVGDTKATKINLHLKITAPETKGFFEIENSTTQIQIGRGKNLEYKKNTENNISEMKLIIPDQHISRKHSIILLKKIANQTQLILKDENSLNGTFLNDQKLEDGDECILSPKDKIKIGTSIIEFDVI